MDRVDLDLLRSVFRYEPDTGKVFFRTSRGNRKAGEQAGSRKKDGRIDIHFQGIFIRAHRLAWYLHHGKLPTSWVDHINGDVSDNRISNLREATPGQNNRNRGMRSDNVSGYKGVYISKRNKGYYMAAIQLPGGPKKYLGRFKSAEKAHQAYCAAADRLYGEFAKYG